MFRCTSKNKLAKTLIITMISAILLTGCGAAGQNSKETKSDATLVENNEDTNKETKETTGEQVKEPTQEPGNDNTEEVGPTPTEEAATEKDDELFYSEILNNYYIALSEKWDVEKLQEASLNWLIGEYEDPLNGVGYLITDLDGNGVQELLIGDVTGKDFMDKMIFDLYTIEEDKPVLVFQGWVRSRYYMCADGIIANEGSSGAAYSDYYLFKLASDGKSLEILEGVRTDTPDITDPMALKWYSTKDTDYDSSNDTLITEEEGLAKVEEFQSKYISMNLHPFSEYKLTENN